MPYKVILSPAVQRDIRRLPESLQQRVRVILRGLADAPRPPGARKVQGQEHIYRLGMGAYRIIYDVFDRQRVIEVLGVSRRTQRTHRGL